VSHAGIQFFLFFRFLTTPFPQFVNLFLHIFLVPLASLMKLYTLKMTK
jgi:hypothetical protein